MKLSESEASIIREFATGVKARRNLCVAIYNRHIKEHCNSDRNECPEMEFMSEILSPCPDLGYRATLRRKLLEKL
jgi:hypothetical protein